MSALRDKGYPKRSQQRVFNGIDPEQIYTSGLALTGNTVLYSFARLGQKAVCQRSQPGRDVDWLCEVITA